MFVGHLALSYAAKRWAPGVSLALLFAASELADVIWPVLVATGIERVQIEPGATTSTPLRFVSYPISHSLLTLIGWGALFGWLVSRTSSDKLAFLVIWLLVVSHWVLDVITHVPDMPLYPGGPKLGLGLWNSVWRTKIVELAMFAAGVWLYWRTVRPRDAVGRWGSVALMLFLVVGFLMPSAPPPSVTALWVVALILFSVIVSWAYWTDRHMIRRSSAERI